MKDISPFFWVDHDNGIYSLCLYSDDFVDREKFLQETCPEKEFAGAGHEWESIAMVLLNDNLPDIKSKIKFNSETEMFSVYSNDEKALKLFAYGFKNACENDEILAELCRKTQFNH